MMRQVLHRTYIARIFSRTLAKYDKDRVQSSHDAAVVYYRLLQLSLTGKMESTCWQQLNLAACSLNLSEAATSIMSREMLAQVYATSAVTVLFTLTDHFQYIARFLLSRCRKQCLRHERGDIPPQLKWLCEPDGHRYLVDLTWYDEIWSTEQGFSTNRHPYDPLSTLMQCYRQHLLEVALYEVITPRRDANMQASLSYLEAIEGTNPQEKRPDAPYDLVTRVDDLAHWWSEMVAVGVHWSSAECSKAEKYYHALSSLPETYLRNQEDDISHLPQAIHDIFRARSGLLTRTMCPYAVNKLCNKASQQLTEDILASANQRQQLRQVCYYLLGCCVTMNTVIIILRNFVTNGDSLHLVCVQSAL